MLTRRLAWSLGLELARPALAPGLALAYTPHPSPLTPPQSLDEQTSQRSSAQAEVRQIAARRLVHISGPARPGPAWPGPGPAPARRQPAAALWQRAAALPRQYVHSSPNGRGAPMRPTGLPTAHAVHAHCPTGRRLRVEAPPPPEEYASVCLGVPRCASVCLGVPRCASVCLGPMPRMGDWATASACREILRQISRQISRRL